MHAAHSWLATVSLGTLAATTAYAGPDESESRSITVPTPEHVYGSEQMLSPRGAPAVVFLNLDGETLDCTQGYEDDSRTNSSWLCAVYNGAGPFEYAAYDGSDAQRQAVISAAREDWAAFNVKLVTERPASGDYTMAMVGPSNFIGGGVLGVAPLDCSDGWKNNVVYAFNGSQHDTNMAATTISQEVAHAYGLEHVGNPSDIMNPSAGVGDPSFTDQCTSIVGGGGAQCAAQHAQNCGSGQQNGYADLMDLFGPSIPDAEDPSVSIVAPTDGDAFEVGESFTIIVEATDDTSVTAVELYVDGQFNSADDVAPYEWPVVGIPEGEHEFYAIAKDSAGNEAISAVVTVHATQDGAPPPGGDGDGSDDGDGEDSMGGGGTGGLPGGPGFGTDEAEVGCGCSTNQGFNGWWMLALPVGLLASRRRRSGTSRLSCGGAA